MSPRVPGATHECRQVMTRLTLNLDRHDFLTHYWQQKPLLIASAIPDFKTPLSANELAGLALRRAAATRDAAAER